jgi:hypothetical protein
MRPAVLALVLLAAVPVRAEVVMGWSAHAAAILVAHDGRIDAFDRGGARRLWSADGLASPSAIAVSPDGRAAILDGFADRVALISIADGQVQMYDTPGTPVAAAFFESDLWVVLREPSRARRITPAGEITDAPLALDPAYIAVSDEFVYVYSRAEGVLHEIDPRSGRVKRNAPIGAGGSDLEIALPKPGDPPGAYAYVCRGMTRKIAAVNLVSMIGHEINAGVAPMDLAFVQFGAELAWAPGTAVTADTGRQVLYASANPGPGVPIRMPSPIDRLTISAAGVFALDTSGGTLYRLDGRAMKKIASALTPLSFVATTDGLFVWDAKAGRPVALALE